MIDPTVSDYRQDFEHFSEFFERLSDTYGADLAQRICTSLEQPRDHCFWHNPLVPWEARPQGEPLAHLPGVWCVPREQQITASEAAAAGAIYVQNPSSVLATQLLAPQPEDEVLDLAAAPGGKTLCMAVAMQNQGRIAAVEPVAGRFHRMRANLARCGVSNADFYQRDGRGVGRAVPDRFDRVLLDAPCSSEARIRWSDPATFGHWSPRKVKECQRKQKSLLRSAYAALKPGGRLLYCTCSFAVEENERVVLQLLRKTDAVLQPLSALPPGLPMVAGLTHWQGKALSDELSLTCRIVPQPPWDGFFLALLTKPGV